MNQLPPPNWFVAFPVQFPSSLRHWLEAWHIAPPSRLRFSKPVDLHLTLAFLGKLDRSEVQAVLNWLESCRSQFPSSLSAVCREVMFLPSSHRCSAISFRVIDPKSTLIQGIEKWRSDLLEQLGKPAEERPVLPHVTVARPRRWKSSDAGRMKMLLSENLPDHRNIRLLSPLLYTRSLNKAISLFRVIPEDFGQ